MDFKKICQQLNFVNECRKYDLSLWECPSFLFVLVGVVNIFAMLGTYFVASEYTEPELVALIVLSVTAVLMIIGYLIVQGFEKLAQANQMKTEFVSIVSHQLRTPLTGIKWAINLMTEQHKEFPREQLQGLKDIKENNERMIRLVNDLLNVSRIEQKRLSFQLEKIFIKKIAEQVIEEHHPLAKANNVELFLKNDSKIPFVMADEQGIKLILSNLIGNAIRYSRGKGEVKIRVIKKPKTVRCEIEDNGVGIPKKDQSRIFQKFFRSENALKHQTTGTGLGLFIAKAFVENFKGKIGFTSEEGKGSTFWFEIPI